MELFFVLLGVSVGVGTVSGLVWFYLERWMERRDARQETEGDLLSVNQEVSDTQGTNDVEQTAAVVAETFTTNFN